jgi:predicted RNA-binding Zn-ribbon protein involved in translation (DUF1610 family)
MAIKFYCKSCQQLLGIAGRKAGTDIDCPQCGQTQLVPSEQTAETAMAMTRFHQSDEIDPSGADGPLAVHDPLDAEDLSLATPASDDRPPTIGMVLVERRTLVCQGILLTLLPIAAGALGYFLGRWDGRPPVAAAPLESVPEEVLMQGRIVWEANSVDNGGEILGDEGAVIIALPEGVLPETTLSIEDIRPQDPYPSSDHKSVKKIDELGGLYARADASGFFPLVFPDSGTYRVLLISRNAARPSDTPIDENDLKEMQKYFIYAEDLIGRHKYRWSTEEISQDSPPIEHSFGRSG